MKSRSAWLIPLLVLAMVLVSLVPLGSLNHVEAETAHTTALFTGTMEDGSTYRIEVPPNWNGTLVLYSHGYVTPGSSNLAQDAPDAVTGAFLLGQGYALAGSSYSQTGWAVQQAFTDQIAVLGIFDDIVKMHPQRTIAWGDSLGGMITAGLIQLYPHTFTAALSMSGVLGGAVGTWNTALDGAFAVNLLLANNTLQIVHINPATAQHNLATGLAALEQAQATPQGRARIALAAALSDVSGWFTPGSPEPAAHDYAAREYNEYLWLKHVGLPFALVFRTDIEARAGGNPSWNTGVNYFHQFAISAEKQTARGLYATAGLSLEQDLKRLQTAPRIAADPAAVRYLTKYITYNGHISVPMLTMHDVGDGFVINQNERAYATIVRRAGNAPLLRQTFIDRAGHDVYTPAERIAAFMALIHRVDTGKWQNSTSPDVLNRAAMALGPSFSPLPPSFIQFEPTLYPRPYYATYGRHE